MSQHYNPDAVIREYSKQVRYDPLDKITNLKVSVRPEKGTTPTDPLELDNCEFVLSRTFRDQEKAKNRKGQRKRKPPKEIGAAKVEGVEEGPDTSFVVSLHFGCEYKGEFVDFDQDLTVYTGAYANLDDYREYIATGDLNTGKLLPEFQYFFREVGKELFHRAQRIRNRLTSEKKAGSDAALP